MKLLYLDCCISVRKNSHTQLLADAFLHTWQSLHPGDEIVHVDLRALPIMPLGETSLHVRENAAAKASWDHPSLALAHQFAQADRIVIAAHFWEMTFPDKVMNFVFELCL